jgi:ABC-type multidrug transport system permease subunit
MSVAGIPSCECYELNPCLIHSILSVHLFRVSVLLLFRRFLTTGSIVLEERSVFFREKKNGLYSTLPFVLANTLVNIPFLFLCTLLFLVICYWAIVCSVQFYSSSTSIDLASTGSTPGSSCFLPILGILVLDDIRCRDAMLDYSCVAADLCRGSSD